MSAPFVQVQGEKRNSVQLIMPRQPKYRKGDVHRFHLYGCNCSRSGGCMTNYCPCYKCKCICSSYCGCKGCRNLEDRPEHEIDNKYETITIQNKDDKSNALIVTPYDVICKEAAKIIFKSVMNDAPKVKQIQHTNE